jgi:hypothetical protein
MTALISYGGLRAAWTSLALTLASTAGLTAQSQEDEVDAHGYDKLRIEQEDKLLVPRELVDEVWRFLEAQFVEDEAFIRGIDPRFSAKWSEELFHDTYFDTPSMRLYDLQSGVRRRHRVNLSDPTDRKSGRELMQIKMNGISENQLERGELKFEIDRIPSTDWKDDRRPMLNMVKAKHHEAIYRRLMELGLDPQTMRPVLTIRDLRRRIYWLRDGQPFMSISHDQASASMWWAHAEFCEIEPELNEIGFTEADAATRAYMETVLERVVGEILAKVPSIRRDLSPKYNKAFDQIEAQLPFSRTLVRYRMQRTDYMYLIGGMLLVAAGGAGWLVYRLARARAAAKNTPGKLTA